MPFVRNIDSFLDCKSFIFEKQQSMQEKQHHKVKRYEHSVQFMRIYRVKKTIVASERVTNSLWMCEERIVQCRHYFIIKVIVTHIYIIIYRPQTPMEAKNEKTLYGYIVSPGNNPTVIENALKKRNVWQALSPDKDLLSASFLWKQLNYSSKVYDDFEEVLKCYPNRHVLLNHFEYNHTITTKSGLLKTLKYYYSHDLAMLDRNCHVHDVIPTSFLIRAHKDDTEYKDFVEKFHQIEKKNLHKEKVPEKHCERNVWFIKPESDNQGKGIILSNNFKEIESFLISKPVNSGWIAQKAIEKPLLYDGRKFDIRVWVLVTPNLEIYYYNTPYMRTSSSMYTTELLNSEIHLTNNCQQKHFSEYSKFQDGNTIPMRQTLLKYIDTLPEGAGRAQEIVANLVTKMKEMIIDTLMSARKYFGKGTKKKEFQLFGYDFLVDEDFRTWLLEVNNNPYLGVPNNFIKTMLPLMVDEMMEIVVDPLFPPENYTPIQDRRFQLIFRESSNFRISPIRVMSSSNDTKYMPKRDKSYSKQKSINAAEKLNTKSDVYNIGKDEKAVKPVYSTPSQTIKYLLDNYCFNDLDPFMVPVTLMLSSSSMGEEQYIETNVKKLKLISQTRIAKVLLEAKPYELCCNILAQDRYAQKIKTVLVTGFANACKTFKAKIFIIKNLMPLICENLRIYKDQIEETYLEAIMKMIIATGAFFDRTVFIPGQSRENQFVRELFIRSNTLKLLLYLKKKYPKVCNNELTAFLDNLSEKDWEVFYDISGNKAKRCYSPKVNTAPENEEETIIINANAINEEKPRVLSIRQNAEIKNFRTRRHSGINSKKE